MDAVVTMPPSDASKSNSVPSGRGGTAPRDSREKPKRDFGPQRVLIADDEHLVASGLASNLRELGHEPVGSASDGELAVKIAREQKPDLALIDIRMPRKQGIEVARQLFEELGIPSIIISAYSDEAYLEQIRDGGSGSGVYAYLLKPVSVDELRIAIGVALQRWSVDAANNGRISQLEKNLANRRIVEQAKWKLVQESGMTEPEAHEKLQRAARNRRTPLADIARAVVERDEKLD